MPVTPLPATKRFIRPGVTEVRFVPTAVNYNALTLAELDAGTALEGQVADVSGWTVTSNLVETPDWGSRFTAKVTGMISADDSSITFWMSSDAQDVRTVLPRDTTGYVVWMDGGETAGGVMDVFPVTVSTLGKLRTTSDPAQIEISFAITSEPSEDQTIPTT